MSNPKNINWRRRRKKQSSPEKSLEWISHTNIPDKQSSTYSNPVWIFLLCFLRLLQLGNLAQKKGSISLFEHIFWAYYSMSKFAFSFIQQYILHSATDTQSTYFNPQFIALSYKRIKKNTEHTFSKNYRIQPWILISQLGYNKCSL